MPGCVPPESRQAPADGLARREIPPAASTQSGFGLERDFRPESRAFHSMIAAMVTFLRGPDHMLAEILFLVIVLPIALGACALWIWMLVECLTKEADTGN